MRRAVLLLLLAMSTFGAERRVIVPAGGVPPVGPYSPGILVGDYLYVSGQGAARPDMSFPTTVEEQTAQCLTNVRRIVEAAGLTMRQVAFATLYLKDLAALPDADRAWRAAFPADPPVRVVERVANMPVGTPVEVTVVAARDRATADRAYSPGLKQPGPCKLNGNTLFCPAQSGDGADIESQVRATMKKLDAELRAAGMSFGNVVATNVYLDNIDDFARMNKVYAESFAATPPTRTTVQPLPATGKTLVRIALIAVK